MGRDSGKGKGGGRGKGRKMFIENMDELTIREKEVSEQRDARARRRAGSDAEEEEGDNNTPEDIDQNLEGKKSAGTSEDASASVFQFERKSRAEFLLETQKKDKDLAADGDSDDDEDDLIGDSYRGLKPKMPKTHNPNHLPKGPERMLKAKDLNDPTIIADPEAGMNRKEKEALAALRAKEEYQRRHMAGETEQAKRELAKLAEVRARREAARLKREAGSTDEGRKPGMSATGLPDDFELAQAAKRKEGSDDEDDDDDDDDDSDEDDDQGKGQSKPKAPVAAPAPLSSSAALAAKKKAAAAEPSANPNSSSSAASGPAKLKAMDIKKMNGDALKEHLKERKLDVQGQKKDLMKRLIDYEEARS